jgi:hypothetical protein
VGDFLDPFTDGRAIGVIPKTGGGGDEQVLEFA